MEQIWARPTCEINGIIGGYTGEGFKTVIPAEASAKVSFRLVDGQDPKKIREAFRDFVKARVPADCRVELHATMARSAGDPARLRTAAARRASALTEEWGKPSGADRARAARSPWSATSSAISAWTPLLVGFGLDDDRIHSPNEKYDLNSFHKGKRSWARILDALAEAPR